ncbi:MAG: GNAT family N-acetyltransferase [Chloroflexota bacterium]
MLVGTKVRLRAIEPADYPLLATWLNDPEIMVYWGRPGNSVSLAEVARDEERQAARGTSRKYMIETFDALAIGQIDYYDLDLQARSTSVSIMIGNPEFLGGGYGSDAMRTLLGYLFRQVGLHRVALNVHRSNERALHSYRKNGFVEEGIMRDWAFFDGHWVDGILMSVLATDFENITAARTT